MSWIAFIGVIIRFVILFWSSWRENDKRKKELKKAALKELADGIIERDPSKITMAFARAKRARR